MRAAYWVVGNDESLGPFAGYMEAEREWRRISWCNADDAEVRYRIELRMNTDHSPFARDDVKPEKVEAPAPAKPQPAFYAKRTYAERAPEAAKEVAAKLAGEPREWR